LHTGLTLLAGNRINPPPHSSTSSTGANYVLLWVVDF
jgi:hypothetical protein